MSRVLCRSLLLLLLAGPTGCSGPAPVAEVPQDKSFQWFQDTVLKSDKVVIADFTATWCGPCQLLKAQLHQLTKEYGDRVKVVAIDVDENPALKARFGIGSIPHMILFSDGEVLANPGPGAPHTYEQLMEMITPWLPAKKEAAAI